MFLGKLLRLLTRLCGHDRDSRVRAYARTIQSPRLSIVDVIIQLFGVTLVRKIPYASTVIGALFRYQRGIFRPLYVPASAPFAMGFRGPARLSINDDVRIIEQYQGERISSGVLISFHVLTCPRFHFARNSFREQRRVKRDLYVIPRVHAASIAETGEVLASFPDPGSSVPLAWCHEEFRCDWVDDGDLRCFYQREKAVRYVARRPTILFRRHLIYVPVTSGLVRALRTLQMPESMNDFSVSFVYRRLFFFFEEVRGLPVSPAIVFGVNGWNKYEERIMGVFVPVIYRRGLINRGVSPQMGVRVGSFRGDLLSLVEFRVPCNFARDLHLVSSHHLCGLSICCGVCEDAIDLATSACRGLRVSFPGVRLEELGGAHRSVSAPVRQIRRLLTSGTTRELLAKDHSLTKRSHGYLSCLSNAASEGI